MKKKQGQVRFCWSFLLIAGMFATPLRAAPAARETAEEEERVIEAIRVFREIAGLRDEGIPASILKKVQGIAIIPGVIKAAYGIGGEYGKGVLLIKERGSWSDPSFIKLVGGSLGWQVGLQKSDLILVFRTRQSIDNIADGKITLGADAAVAAGPVGRGAQATTDLEMKAEIYAYSIAKGFFIGISLKGAVIQIDTGSNERFYGVAGLSARDIFRRRPPESPPVVERLKALLADYLGSVISI